MVKNVYKILSGMAVSILAVMVIAGPNDNPQPASKKGKAMSEETEKSGRDWKKELTPEQYRVLREKGTERPFTGEYNKEKAKGTYRCAGCGQELFKSDSKFDSGTGWPSFFQPISGKVNTGSDSSHGMSRDEVVCSNCGGHLGHVFDDGPKPTGQRYCINSVSLKLDKE